MAGKSRFRRRWTKFWMKFAGLGFWGRQASRLAAWTAPPYYGCIPLAQLHSKGYISAKADIFHDAFNYGRHCFLGDRVTIYKDGKGGEIKLRDGVHLHNDITIQTGKGGTVTIGDDTHIQPGCQFSAYLESIRIGSGVEIAPNCALYSYNHSMLAGLPIREQPLVSRGDIVVGNDVWLGYGVVVLDGVTIGNGAVIGAGSVVTSDIPANAIAVGSPARVVAQRKSA